MIILKKNTSYNRQVNCCVVDNFPISCSIISSFSTVSRILALFFYPLYLFLTFLSQAYQIGQRNCKKNQWCVKRPFQNIQKQNVWPSQGSTLCRRLTCWISYQMVMFMQTVIKTFSINVPVIHVLSQTWRRPHSQNTAHIPSTSNQQHIYRLEIYPNV